MTKTYQVGELAKISGVSVRTLHHYDAVGLLTPSGRTEAGYRLYTQADLLRLQQILIHRELDFPLEEIRRILDDPAFEQRAALVRQRTALEGRIEHAQQVLASIDQALASLDDGAPRVDDGLFKGFDPAKYEAEAEARWGHTEAFRISKERTATYGEAEWQKIRRTWAEIYDALHAVQARGEAATSPEAMDLAERHRVLMHERFFPCDQAMHVCLADLYEDDPRFAANIDQHGEGLARFLSAAIRANAARA